MINSKYLRTIYLHHFLEVTRMSLHANVIVVVYERLRIKNIKIPTLNTEPKQTIQNENESFVKFSTC